MSQVHLKATEKTPSYHSINWNEVGRLMLKYSLPINPMSTQPDDKESQPNQLHIDLDCLQNPNRRHIDLKHHNTKSFPFPSLKSKRLNGNQTQTESLFEYICDLDKKQRQKRNVAIIGESGTGKTLFLQIIAHWMLDKTDYVPIWLSPGQLTNLTLKDYLTDKWLIQCTKHYRTQKKLSQELWQESLRGLLESGRVWLLADGMDYLLAKSINEGNQSPLNILIGERNDLMGNCHLMLTCQTVTWKMQSQALSEFDIYQTKSLAKQSEIQQFVKQWFVPYSSQPEQSESQGNLGEKLSYLLSQPDKQHLHKWLKNPLRLSLFCRFWQKNCQSLPQTAASLYQVLVDEFYQWQAETTPVTPEEQQQLNQFLTQLAFNHRQTQDAYSAISPEMVKDNQSLLSLSLQLHWLRPVGILSQQKKDNPYQFEDQTFENYFAALAIDHWQYFLNQETTTLEMFSDQWQQILLFWLGREEIASEEKEALIKALISFEDECGQENFYGFRAYIMAAIALSEFPHCSLRETIIQQVLTWGLTDTDSPNLPTLVARQRMSDLYRPLVMTHLINLITKDTQISQQKRELFYLQQLGKGNTEAIAALTQCLPNTEDENLRWQLAQTLGIIDPGNPTAISFVVKKLETANSEQDYQKAFLGLEKIAQGEGQGVKALVRLLHHQPTPNLRRRIFQCLEIVGQGNATAIAILVQLIRTTKDETIRRQAAESLEKIDPGNPTAIAGLIKLMETATTQSIRQEVVYSLGEVCPGNSQAIAALVRLLEDNEDTYLRWIAISSLGKIGLGNEQAVRILEKLIKPDQPLLIRKEALDSLGKIDPNNPEIVKASIQLMEAIEDEETYREIAENLGKIDPGNPKAINALTKLLQISTDQFALRQVAVSLGKIDPGNLEALMVLVNLIQSTRDPDIRSLAAESLGEIGHKNPAAIATLIRLLETSSHLQSRRCAAKSLSKIAIGNKGAIAAFVQVLPTIKDQDLGQQVAEGLITILSQKQMPQVVTQLRDYVLETNLEQDSPCYRVIWHCAQNLSYQAFMEAWHQRSLPEKLLSSSQITETKATETITGFETLQQQLSNHAQLESTQIIWIESRRFIDPDHPAIDIYDQMLEQNCSAFDHGLPETLSKLRLYWHLLQRKSPKSPLILLFYEEAKDRDNYSLSPHLLKSLEKFKGIIGVITRQESSGLSIFSPDDPQLGDTLLTWMTETL
ncbi:HEAT repeat domain-containing protein [Cyanothece sp. BG0011]|uniref:HEAT repeat domain-containing protein n=1 Tax=Cyanothece sp. BG0011 TaxID=2082950 RepID=UPI000D1F3744|nr:HEAT repeat domain-containing protein [Cyanothece sp. BG0011]